MVLEVGFWLLGLKLCLQCNHVFACRASKEDCTDHVQLALHKKYTSKGHENVSHQNKQRDIQHVVLYVSQTHLWHEQTNWRTNVKNKEGYHSMQQPMQVNILWLQDTLATLWGSLSLSQKATLPGANSIHTT